ncbi:MAG: MotA/TolQ/ExbB proton channel family protein [Deltaproteobacteria bacterium]|nr:MotA/TolQ/ExbB proton channel family protein [Deltaproteobacteria bacterium]
MLIEKLFVIAQITTSVVLYALIALSVISIGVIVERWWYFLRRRCDYKNLEAAVTPSLCNGDAVAAQDHLAKSRSLEASIIKESLDWYNEGPAAFTQIVDKNIRQKRKEYESGLLFLGTIGNNAPFIGLFGTVLGIVTAFRGLANTTSAGAMGNVMAAIAEALIATAIGILVAIPAVVAYNIFEKKGSIVEENTQSLAAVAVATLESQKNHNSENEHSLDKRKARMVVGG